MQVCYIFKWSSSPTSTPLYLFLFFFTFWLLLLLNVCRHCKNPAVHFSYFFFLKLYSSVPYICVVSLNFPIWLQLFCFAPQPLMNATQGCFIISSLNRFASPHIVLLSILFFFSVSRLDHASDLTTFYQVGSDVSPFTEPGPSDASTHLLDHLIYIMTE